MVLVYWIYHCVSFSPSFYLPLFLSFFPSPTNGYSAICIHRVLPPHQTSSFLFLTLFPGSGPSLHVQLTGTGFPNTCVASNCIYSSIVSPVRDSLPYLPPYTPIYIGWNSRLKLLFIPNLIILSSLSLSFAFSISLHTYLYPTSTLPLLLPVSLYYPTKWQTNAPATPSPLCKPPTATSSPGAAQTAIPVPLWPSGAVRYAATVVATHATPQRHRNSSSNTCLLHVPCMHADLPVLLSR